ncbi:MAG: alpha/beta hydrolase [Citromicrobium sp.]|nr:alpha/beta hydrolase [Citromicrobium sp.]
MGDLRISHEGTELALPASRKTRALCGYLALVDQKHSRQSLCELLWEIPDDPRGALRWSLSKLRGILNRSEQVLLTYGDWVELERKGLQVDVVDLQRACESESLSRQHLSAYWESANLGLLCDCDISGQDAFSSWLEGEREKLALTRARVARRLACDPACPDPERVAWADRWLADMACDPDAAQAAVEARRRAGQHVQASQLAERLAARFREAELTVPDFAGTPPPGPARAPAPPAGTAPAPARQSIRFAKTRDGASIAWASVSTKGRTPLVKAANWLSHLELDWEAPIWSPLFRELSQNHEFIRYDERGCGVSDWDVEDISFESFVNDLELVVDAAKVDRFPLLGISQGAAVSIEYAARHPDRVSHLILFGGYAAGWRHTAKPEEVSEREAVMTLTKSGWGRSNPAYRRLFSQTFMPDATAEELEWFDEFQRRTTSAENAVRFLEAFASIDVRHRLKDVQAPTLVVHSRGDQRIPVAQGQALAAQIPDSQFVGLDTRNHLLLGRETASSEFLKAVSDFLADS